MNRILMSMTVLLTVGLGACAGSSLNTGSTGSPDKADASNLPIYQVSWDGCIDGSNCVSDEVTAYVWGSPNPSDRPAFESTGALVVGLPDFRSPTQDYNVAFESFGCFPESSAPESEKQLHRIPASPVLLPRRPTGQNPRQIPIEVQVSPVDSETQQRLLEQAEASQIALPGSGCEWVQG